MFIIQCASTLTPHTKKHRHRHAHVDTSHTQPHFAASRAASRLPETKAKRFRHLCRRNITGTSVLGLHFIGTVFAKNRHCTLRKVQRARAAPARVAAAHRFEDDVPGESGTGFIVEHERV